MTTLSLVCTSPQPVPLVTQTYSGKDVHGNPVTLTFYSAIANFTATFEGITTWNIFEMYQMLGSVPAVGDPVVSFGGWVNANGPRTVAVNLANAATGLGVLTQSFYATCYPYNGRGVLGSETVSNIVQVTAS